MVEKITELNEQLAELCGVVGIVAQAAVNDTDEEYFQKNIPGSLQHIKNELERIRSEYYDIEYQLSQK